MKRLLAAGITLTALTLGACSSSPATQSTEEACLAITDSMTKLEAELSQVGDSEEDMREMVILAKNNLGKLNKEITNPEVKEVWEPISELQIQGLEAAANEDSEGAMNAYLGLSEHYEAFAEVCPQDVPQS